MSHGWRDRILATLMAMAGVVLTFWVYSHFISGLHLGRGLKSLYLRVVLVFFTGVFSFVVFGLLERQQRELERANAELGRQRDVLQGLWDATGVVATLPDLEAVLQRIVDVARPLFGAQYAALAVLSDEDPSRIREFITSGISSEARAKIGHLPTGRGLLGEVIRTKQVIRLENIADHPASSGFPNEHPAMSSFLGLPLLYQGSVVGHLYLTNKPGGFTSEDEVLAQLFSRQAAVVIANARLYQEREAWATVQERERIGRELHDGVLQTLYGLTLSLEFLLDTQESLSEDLRRELNRVTETLSLTMTDIRMYIQSLGTSPVDFYVAVKDMLHRTGNGENVDLEFHDHDYLTLDPQIVHDLVLTVQEAVSNANRHGQADRIVVGWESTEWEYHLWIEDNGVGFDTEADTGKHHFGLENMRRRMERLKGMMDVTSAPGRGTTVQFRWPRSNTISL
ncbi:GAF domain-containing sensor histidine kinase [Sulfobacillus harzensis]|uniref:histidine kinase n=1 Tax=Sulfobacillus harzensis TaxID=2729629 RepID=A0A7Y0L6I3_9FIRM|nr:GAF domain-containing sensor histidine kinase [Sulfobacillus harzensis]NMP24224.1 GAF domain-containing sensor histidine kinase [Sulfobacillus harzensis]